MIRSIIKSEPVAFDRPAISMPPSRPESPSRPHGHSHYSPRLGRLLVCALYHEARKRKKPMTRLADELLAASLTGTDGLRIAEEQFPGPAVSKATA